MILCAFITTANNLLITKHLVRQIKGTFGNSCSQPQPDESTSLLRFVPALMRKCEANSN